MFAGREGTAAITTHCARSGLYIEPIQASLETLLC